MIRINVAAIPVDQVFTVDELQKYPKTTKTVTHKCTTSGNVMLALKWWPGVSFDAKECPIFYV